MGAGKTTYALRMIDSASVLTRFIYITPFLSEVDRVINSVSSRNFKQPDHKVKGGTKLNSFKQLVEQQCDIVTTHALFMSIDDELLELLKQNSYTLIIDEAFDVISKSTVSIDDMNLLRNQSYIEIDNYRVRWTDKGNDYKGTFADIKNRAQAGTLYYHSETFLIDVFPSTIFTAFREVYILTYLFKAQLMSYYFELFKLNYTHLTINENKLIPYDAKLEQRHLKLELIDLYDGNFNVFGDKRTAFSSTWLSRCKDDDFTAIKNAMYGYVRNVIKAKSGDVLWTTKKVHKGNLSGRGYTKGFISLNIRATNDYSTRSTMMYMYNRFMNPIEKSFFQDNGIKVNEDLLAVSDLLQWIWRSRIRNDEPISLYIPSLRMRNLLLDWAKYNL